MKESIDYVEAGFTIVMLHNVLEGGRCECGDEDCKLAGKHPSSNSWNIRQHYTEAQKQGIELALKYKNCYGVLCDGYLVVDIDPRNGGSLEAANTYFGINLLELSKFAVATGGGGQHIYFKYQGEKLASKLADLPGVDFKQAGGYVVGDGSLHKSGNRYEKIKGFPQDITEAPSALVKALEIKSNTFVSLTPIKAEYSDLQAFLSYAHTYDDYKNWIEVGMALYDATKGSQEGYSLWYDWSKQSKKFNAKEMPKKWASFHDREVKITVATLKKMAIEGGYKEAVTFKEDETLAIINDEKTRNKAIDEDLEFDKFNLPGLVGEITQHIIKSSFSRCDNLALSAALQIISNIAGLRYVFDFGLGHGETSIALYSFCVAASGTGKDHPKNMISRYMQSVKGGRAIFSDIKSTKEMVNNALEEDANCYVIDELGIKLRRMIGKNAPDFMQAMITVLLSQYSATDGKFENMTGDVRREVIEKSRKEVFRIEEALSEKEYKGTEAHANARIDFLKSRIDDLNNGFIKNNYLTIWGATTPETFADIMTKEQVDTGLIGRCLIFEETHTITIENENPIPKEIPEYIAEKIKYLLFDKYSEKSLYNESIDRVSWYGKPKTVIYANDEARAEILKVKKKILAEQKLEAEREEGGLETMLNRTVEIVQRLSAIIAVGDKKIITAQHVRYAFEIVINDAYRKLDLVRADIAKQNNNRSVEIVSKVKTKLSATDPITIAKIRNRLRNKFTAEDIAKTLELLIKAGTVKKDNNKYLLK